MKVLVINCGSSSLKYQLIDSSTEEVLAVGLCERIGIDGIISHKPKNGEKEEEKVRMENHEVAVKMALDKLIDRKVGVITSLDEIGAVGHRVVHGGEQFSTSVVITPEVEVAIEKCNELAPLHNPANIIGINACKTALPNVPMVAVFDTAFHQSMPAKSYLYGIPKSYYDNYKIRRYGFHGTSHSFVSRRLAELANLDINHSKLVVCHIGNGASVTAVKDGKSIDTSMGLTPLEGLIMGTRSGDLDPAILEYISKKENKSIQEVLEVLNKKSGMLGMSGGISSDFRDILKASEEGNMAARETLNAFVYRIVKYIGAYVAAMNGIDAIAFTAGIGENGIVVRERVLESLGYLGIELNKDNNAIRGEEVMISTEASKVKVFVVPTNEELAIARETTALIS